MKRASVLRLCLALLFLSGCGAVSPAPAPPSTPAAVPESAAPTGVASPPAPETADPVPDAEPQAFAMTMALWAADAAGTEDWRSDAVFWDAAGWYAAWLNRTEGVDLLERSRAEDFLRSLGAPISPLPQGWQESGIVRVLRGADGSEQLDFAQHKLEINEMMGITTEISIRSAPDRSVVSRLTYHFEDGQAAHWSYQFRFSPPSNGPFSWQLTDVVLPDRGAETDPALTFDWDGLCQANRLDSLFSLYSSVRICNVTYSPDVNDWLFPRGDSLVIATQVGSYVDGEYRGCRFLFAPDGEEDRPVITEFDPDAGNSAARNDTLLDYLSGITLMRLDRIAGDRILADATFRGGSHESVTVDLGSLALREISYRYSDQEEPSTTVFFYDEPQPDWDWLQGWDGPLRTVTLHWEDWTDGQHSTWTEEHRIPADWELVPRQAQWGDFTIWMDPGSTQPYAYPGDGVDYTLYLSSAKG